MSRIALVEGVRTPFIKVGSDFADFPASELGRIVVRELLERTSLDPHLVDEVIFGNVATPADATNIARVIAVLSGIPQEKIAYTVSRNCASGLEAITCACEKVESGVDQIIIAGGAESMSNIPLLYQKETTQLFAEIFKTKKFWERFKIFLKFRPRHFFNPLLGLKLGLTDPLCGLIMGDTAEILVKEYGITRKEQDEFALVSHQRALFARSKLKEEIVPVYLPPKFEKVIEEDNGMREDISLEKLAKLKPFFEKITGTVTVGNSSQVTDGAAAVLIMEEEKAKELNFESLGFVRAYTYVGVDPSRMGIAPAYAIPKVLKKAGLKLSDMELIEINEAFAAQIIAVERQLEKDGVGKLKREILNVNGGAIALGHPVGATGTRLVLTLLKEMKRRNLKLGLVSLCIGGGQGGAMVLER